MNWATHRVHHGIILIMVFSLGVLGLAYAEDSNATAEDSTYPNTVTGEVEREPGDTETFMLPGDVPLEMVWIPPGTFMMGRYPGEQDSIDWEDPQHEVTLTSGYWMGKYPVTKGQWKALMDTTPWSDHYVLDDPDSPAVYVVLRDIRAFISALNEHTGMEFRLPTEAEWEHAVRAGTTTRFYWGDDPDYTKIDDYAWWRGNASDLENRYAHVVGQKLPNDFGLYDMSGNVWEWCEDRFGDYPSDPQVDPTGPGSGTFHALRGGAWEYHGHSCRSAARSQVHPITAYTDVGFRLAR